MFRFYRFIRRHSRPVAYDVAEKWDKRLAIAYNLLVWNAFGLTVWYIYSSGGSLKPPSAENIVENLQLKNVEIVKVHGISSIQRSRYVPDSKEDGVSQTFPKEKLQD
ncbi:hypothetical protein CHUAL_010879 [Chamberlinius hualienensis]